MAEEKESPLVSGESTPIEKKLELVVPDSVSNRFTNFTVVQRDTEIFTLSFFEIQKPAILGSEEEARNVVREMASIPAVCVARIVMTPSHFKKLFEAMQANLEKYQKTVASAKRDKGSNE